MSNNCERQTNNNSNIIIQCLVINARLDKKTSDQYCLFKLNKRLIRIVR